MKTSTLFDGARWTREPSLDELLSDPVLHAVVRRDGLTVETVRSFARDMGRRLTGAA
jgi:hypothetical protein